MREREVLIFHNGNPVGRPMGESEALVWLMRNQPHSVDHALRFGGYACRTVGEFGGVCSTVGCSNEAVTLIDHEREHGMYRCGSCSELINGAIPPFSPDGALSHDDYQAMVEAALAMSREQLTSVGDVFTP